MQVMVNTTTREIIQHGLVLGLSPDPDNFPIVELLDDEVPKLYQIGIKILGLDNIITVTPPPFSPDFAMAEREEAQIEGIA